MEKETILCEDAEYILHYMIIDCVFYFFVCSIEDVDAYVVSVRYDGRIIPTSKHHNTGLSITGGIEWRGCWCASYSSLNADFDLQELKEMTAVLTKVERIGHREICAINPNAEL